MPLDASTRLYGVFGNPVRHSLSPLIHNEAFRRAGLNAAYLAFEIEPHSLPLAFEAARALGLGGFNLTLPFKEEAAGLVDEIPEDVDRALGAVNTVVQRDGQLYGYNTDVPGLLTALAEELSFDPRAKKVVVAGAGGAARSAAFALARAGARRIWIHNRTRERAEGLAEYLGGYFPDTEIETLDGPAGLDGETPDLIVNATSCGLNPTDGLPFDAGLVAVSRAAYDLVYAPRPTPLLAEADRLGLPCAGGLGMLAAQAAAAFELWTGRGEGVRQQMLETLKQCRS